MNKEKNHPASKDKTKQAIPSLGSQFEDLMHNSCPKRLRYFFQQPFLAAIIYILLASFIEISLARIFGGSSGTPNVVDINEHKGLEFAHIFIGVAIYYYFKLPFLLTKTFEALHREKIFVATEVTINPNVKNTIFSPRIYWMPYGLVFSTALILIIVISFDSLMWFQLHPVMYVTVMLTWMVGWFAVAGVIVNFGMSIYLIHRIFQDNEIIIFPLHPDKCGGFNSLGLFSLRLVSLAIVYGFMLTAWAVGSLQDNTIGSDYGLALSTLVYIIIVPVFFYLPLHSVHVVMVAYRNNLMKKTSEGYTQEHLSLYQDETLKTDTLKQQLEKMEAIKDLQEQLRKYPVWPFNFRIRIAVVLNAGIPLAATVIGTILDLVSTFS